MPSRTSRPGVRSAPCLTARYEPMDTQALKGGTDMQGEGDRTDLATLIQEQSDLKVRVIDGPGYSFPPRLKSSDWWGTAILAVAMLILLIAGAYM